MRLFLGLRTKLIILSLLMVVPLVILVRTVFVGEFEKQRLKEVENTLKLITQNWFVSTMQQMESIKQIVNEKEEAIVRSMSNLNDFIAQNFEFNDGHLSVFPQRLNLAMPNKSYVFVLKTNGEVIYHPKYPMHYNILSDQKLDEKSRHFVRDLIARGKETNGIGNYSARYQWPNPETNILEQKILSAKYLPKNKIIICSVMLRDDSSIIQITNELQQSLINNMLKAKYGNNGYPWIFTSKGIYVLSKDRKRDGANIYDTQSGKNYAIREMIKLAIEAKPGEIPSYTYQWKNEDDPYPKTKISYLQYIKEWDWVIGIGAYHEDIFAPVLAFRKTITIYSMALAAMGILLSVLFSHYITRSIRYLMEALAKIKDGSYNEKVPIISNDELGVLSRSFNEMSSIIYEQRQGLKMKNRHLNLLRNFEKEKNIFRKSTDRLHDTFISFVEMIRRGMTDGNNCWCQVDYGDKQLRSYGCQPTDDFLLYDISYYNVLIQVRIGVANGMMTTEQERIFIESAVSSCRNFLSELELDEKNKEIQISLLENSKLATLGEMASGIAHEINNPLSVISGYTKVLEQMVRAGNLSLKQLLEITKAIQSTVVRMAKIIKGLRRFAREASEDPMEKKEIKQIIDDTLAFCHEKFISHEVELDVSKVPENLAVLCRDTEMSQVLLNLLSNSYDAIEKQKIKWVRVEAHEEEENVLIEVIDSGNGISKELAQKIFHPFFTTKEVGKGTGLGLSISHGILKKHNGDLYYDEESDHTKFVIKLPKAA